MDGESNKKPFTFDFSYDSMDTFNPNYASQDQVLHCMCAVVTVVFFVFVCNPIATHIFNPISESINSFPHFDRFSMIWAKM